MTTLYGNYHSRASRALWLLEEIKLPFKLTHVVQAVRLADPLAPDAPLNTRSAEFRKLSPMGAIPVLEDDGLILAESLAINLHLARKSGGPLAPANERELALMEQWALFAATWIENDTLALTLLYRRGEQDSEAGRQEIARLTGKLARPLAALEAHLEGHSHMVGGRFTVADINTAEILRYGMAYPQLLDAYPRLARWLELCHARAGFRDMWRKFEAEPV
ncbi:glutathione S-transferase [Thioclava dalianensis]|uniref:Glutathione S-transferase n=1 Tax=Thioclava dalianensis TaxID=1185766 RepID=A0A074THY6_9RHOB|nr:glutathione S-transferase family protein [Thioclava dalianensis]KEP68653.1 glutathione S-transferase [Thioclava dalianensis]SFN03891.1 glutathione S-transferase [Thioclava dalianensis]